MPKKRGERNLVRLDVIQNLDRQLIQNQVSFEFRFSWTQYLLSHSWRLLKLKKSQLIPSRSKNHSTDEKMKKECQIRLRAQELSVRLTVRITMHNAWKALWLKYEKALRERESHLGSRKGWSLEQPWQTDRYKHRLESWPWTNHMLTNHSPLEFGTSF